MLFVAVLKQSLRCFGFVCEKNSDLNFFFFAIENGSKVESRNSKIFSKRQKHSECFHGYRNKKKNRRKVGIESVSR
jgi:hypothetical protein